MKLEEKTALVTGAGRGLGREIALALAREGAKVVLFSRTLDELESVAAEISAAGGDSLVIQGDIGRPGDVAGMIQKTVDRFKTLDILVNNAAITGPPEFIRDNDLEAWQRTLDVNLNGPARAARDAAPIMAGNNYGRIIFLSSGLGRIPFPRFCAYSVSKAGIIQLTRSLSEEFKPLGITVNAIDPGVMDTPMQEHIRALGPEKLGREVFEQFTVLKTGGHLKNPREVAPPGRISGFRGGRRIQRLQRDPE